MPFTEPLFTSDAQDWATPMDLFRQLDAEFHFTLDVCATAENTKVPSNYYTPEQDGLAQDWQANVCFCNPPYKDVAKWAQKCWLASQNGATVVLLTFARTDTRYFHDYILPYAELRFIKGRVKFVKNGASNSAPAPSILAIYRPLAQNT